MGIITVAVLLLVAPFEMWAQRSRQFRSLPPIEQNLQRASHGPALVVLALVVAGYGSIARAMSLLAENYQQDWLVIAVIGVLAAYAVPRFVYAFNRMAGARDGLLLSRAVTKTIIGAGVTYYFAQRNPFDLPIDEGWSYLMIAGYLAGIWCLVTGGIRALLLSVGDSGGKRPVERDSARRQQQWKPVRRR